jgi:integrase
MTRRDLLTTRRVELIRKKGEEEGEFRTYLDGHGLLLVGSKKYRTYSWKQRLYKNTTTGKPRDVGLGSASDVTLKEARARGHALRQLAIDGIDPLEQRRKELAERRAEASSRVTLGQAHADFMKVYGPTWKNDKHRKQWATMLTSHASALRSVPVSEIDQAAINEVLLPVFKRAPETSRRVRERLNKIIRWIKDGRPHPVTTGNGQAKHHAALPYAAVPEFMPRLRGRSGNTARCLEFCILTAARSGEARGALWSEINFDEKTWTVPAERMKSGREHTVPLSARAIEILKSQPRSGDLVFPGARGGQLNEDGLRQNLKKLDASLTVHGFRSSFRDWAGDSTNFPNDIIEHALAHAVKSKTEAAYRRGSALQKRRALMESWAQFCESPQHGATVTQLRKKA